MAPGLSRRQKLGRQPCSHAAFARGRSYAVHAMALCSRAKAPTEKVGKSVCTWRSHAGVRARFTAAPPSDRFLQSDRTRTIAGAMQPPLVRGPTPFLRGALAWLHSAFAVFWGRLSWTTAAWRFLVSGHWMHLHVPISHVPLQQSALPLQMAPP